MSRRRGWRHHHHHRMHLRHAENHPWLRMTRLGWYVRARLHRRLFLWFGFSIVFTALAVAGVSHLTGGHWGGFLGAMPLLTLVFVLWAASGRIAWRIARPLSELARVAGELGAGEVVGAGASRWIGTAWARCGLLAAVFNDMADRIERQVADQRELLAGVSHELRHRWPAFAC